MLVQLLSALVYVLMQFHNENISSQLTGMTAQYALPEEMDSSEGKPGPL